MAKKKQTKKKETTNSSKKEKEINSTTDSMWSNKAIAFVLAFISIVLYANSFGHGFTVDDTIVISENKIVQKGISNIGNIWTSSYLEGYNNEVDAAYRPISLTQFALENTIFGKGPEMKHVMHVIYYALGIFLCYLFSVRLFKGNKVLAIGTTLLYLAHPIHTEVVNNLKSRDEIMMMVGIMGMCYFYLEFLKTERSKHLLFALISYFVALFSKETSIAAFLIIPALYLWNTGNKDKKLWVHSAYFFGMALFYFFMRTAVVGTYDIEMDYMNNALLRDGGNVFQRFPDAMVLFGKYITMLFVPYPLSVDYSYNSIPLNGWSSPWAYVSILASGALLFFGVQGVLKKQFYGVAFLWFFVTILVASNIFLLIGSTFAERFLFVPSFAFCALLAFGIHHLAGKKTWIIASVIAMIYGGWTFTRNKHWQSDSKLFSRDVKYQENNARVQTFYGKFLYEDSKEMEAEKKSQILQNAKSALEKAVEIAPDYMVANYYNGFVSKAMNLDAEALAYFKKVVEIEPEFATAHLHLGIAYAKNDLHKEAIEEYLWLEKNGRSDITLINNIAFSYMKSKNYKKSEEYYLKAYSMAPEDQKILSNMIKLYRDGMKNMPEALRYNDILKKVIAKKK